MVDIGEGSLITSTSGEPITIEKYEGNSNVEIREGGKNVIISKHFYKVQYRNEKKMLTWYPYCDQEALEQIRYNIMQMAELPSPSDMFNWPEEYVEIPNNKSFGFISPLVDKRFDNNSDKSGKEKDGESFLSALNPSGAQFSYSQLKTIACVAVRIIDGFERLHQSGFCFQNIKLSRFFVDKNSNDVRCFADEEIVPCGTKLNIVIDPDKVAPEVIKNTEAVPNELSDRYSLAILLFIMLFDFNPFLGKKSVVPYGSIKTTLDIFANDPIFIFDEDDTSNGLIFGVTDIVEERWNCLPGYVKNAFRTAFSSKAIHDPAERMKEYDWMKIMTRLCNDTLSCNCGKFAFYNQKLSTVCTFCGQEIKVKNVIGNFDESFDCCEFPIAKRNVIFSQMIDFSAPFNEIIRVGVKKDDPNTLLLRNTSGETIVATTPTGAKNDVPNEKVIPVRSGISINILGRDFVIKNKAEQ